MVYYSGGATAVGLVYSTGAVLAADRRVTYGPYIMSRAVKKVAKITDRIGIACAGFPSDFQKLLQYFKFNFTLYEQEAGIPLSVYGSAKLLSTLMYSRRLIPFLTELIVAGVDEGGAPKLYSLDAVGSVLEDKYAAIGTGTELALAVLEKGFRENMSREEAIRLAEDAMRVAIARDVLSGDGIDFLILDEKAAEEKFIKLR
ncbi:MAG: proteasome subunit beta [Thermoproteota archaeon]|nr:MAG: proteasome subunit beta [Candidatus Korarchaeota archaeon]